MANEGLKAELSRVEHVLNSVRRENQEIEGDIAAVESSMIQAEQDMSNTRAYIQSSLDNDNNRLLQAHRNVVNALEIQGQMEDLYQRFKYMEMANKQIRACNDKKYYDFKVYRQVRKIVQGVMDDMDFSMVSDEMIAKAVEKSQLQQPDYWLTSAMLAFVNWRSDNRADAERALVSAMTLDDRKTASFFMVFNLRLASLNTNAPGMRAKREQAALKWFDYLALTGRQPGAGSNGDVEPAINLKGAEKPLVLLFFSMLSNTIRDKVSDTTRIKVTNYVNELIKEDLETEGSDRSLVARRIADEFSAFADDHTFGYESIRTHVMRDDCAQLVNALALARNNANIISFVNDVTTVPTDERNQYLKDYIDRIVEQPCKTEIDVYDEIERNEFIIKCQGDKELALQQYAAKKQYEESNFHIVAEMMNWIYSPDASNMVNGQMRKNMFCATKQLQQEGYTEYRNRYRAMVSPLRTVTIDNNPVQVDLSKPEESKAMADDYFKRTCAEQQHKISDMYAYIAIVVGVVLAVAMVFVYPPLIALGAVAALVGGFMLVLNHKQRNNIFKHYQLMNTQAAQEFDALAGEWNKFMAEFSEADRLSETVVSRIDAAV